MSVHVGGGYGGGGYHGYCGPSYGGRGCYYYGGNRGYYGGYYAYPVYGYASYGYGAYGGYASYPDSSSYYGADYSSPSYAPAPQPTPPAPQPAPAPAAISPSTSMAAGTVDATGNVHSPYSATTFKVDKFADGQIFHDPITGQAFVVHKSETAPAPAPAVPPTTATPTGKLDEFGYVHSPFSTFTFKVQSGNYAQVFHDPFTGQAFTIARRDAAEPVASTASSVRTD